MVCCSMTISFDPTTVIQGHAFNTEQGFISDKSPNVFTPPPIGLFRVTDGKKLKNSGSGQVSLLRAFSTSHGLSSSLVLTCD